MRLGLFSRLLVFFCWLAFFTVWVAYAAISMSGSMLWYVIFGDEK